MMKPTAHEAVGLVRQDLAGTYTMLAGSAVAAEFYDKPAQYDDLDVFCPTAEQAVSVIQFYLDKGAVMEPRNHRAWQRWRKWGVGNWQTNSIKLELLHGVELNIIFKRERGNAVRTLHEVLGGFDFGHLAMGYDMRTDTFRNMQSYFYGEGVDPHAPLEMMPDRRDDWVEGFMSDWSGPRQGYRYGKHVQYTYDLSAVKPDMIRGYVAAAEYHGGKDTHRNQLLAEIYEAQAEKVRDDRIDELVDAYQEIEFEDSLDQMHKVLT